MTILDRSSCHQRCSVMKGVLRNVAKSTGKPLCQSLIFNEFVSLRPVTLLKKRLWHRCFHLNFVKVLRTPSLRTRCSSSSVIKIVLWKPVVLIMRIIIHIIINMNNIKQERPSESPILNLNKIS